MRLRGVLFSDTGRVSQGSTRALTDVWKENEEMRKCPRGPPASQSVRQSVGGEPVVRETSHSPNQTEEREPAPSRATLFRAHVLLLIGLGLHDIVSRLPEACTEFRSRFVLLCPAEVGCCPSQTRLGSHLEVRRRFSLCRRVRQADLIRQSVGRSVTANLRGLTWSAGQSVSHSVSQPAQEYKDGRALTKQPDSQPAGRQTESRTDGQTDGQAGGQAGRQTDRQVDKQMNGLQEEIRSPRHVQQQPKAPNSLLQLKNTKCTISI
jgi:hypothetical protein